MQSDTKIKDEVRHMMPKPTAGKRPFAPLPRWLAAFGHPDAKISDTVRGAIAAMPVDQRGEFLVEGGEWIELFGSNEYRAEGRTVLADRGDRLQIHFDHVMATAEIDVQGQFLILGADDEVIARHEPARKAIVARYESHTIRFQRVTDVLAEADSSTVHGGRDIDGAEEFDRGLLSWKLSFEAPELVTFLEGYIGGEAMEILRYHIHKYVSQAIAQAMDAAALNISNGAQARSQFPPLQPRRAEILDERRPS